MFYDLVFVVLIAEVAHALAAHPSPEGLATYGFLFAIVWWAWANGSLYHDLHGSDDTRTRTFTFLQMMAVGGMAAFAHDAIGAGSIGFAISYAALHAILTWLWYST
ncbi:MAG: low temperature requirement protein A, partial [Bacteroidota bacterium]